MEWLSAVLSEALNDGRAKDIDQVHGIFSLDSERHQELRPRRLTEAALKFLVGFDIPLKGGRRQFDKGGLWVLHRFVKWELPLLLGRHGCLAGSIRRSRSVLCFDGIQAALQRRDVPLLEQLLLSHFLRLHDGFRQPG